MPSFYLLQIRTPASHRHTTKQLKDNGVRTFGKAGSDVTRHIADDDGWYFMISFLMLILCFQFHSAKLSIIEKSFRHL